MGHGETSGGVPALKRFGLPFWDMAGTLETRAVTVLSPEWPLKYSGKLTICCRYLLADYVLGWF